MSIREHGMDSAEGATLDLPAIDVNAVRGDAGDFRAALTKLVRKAGSALEYGRVAAELRKDAVRLDSSETESDRAGEQRRRAEASADGATDRSVREMCGVVDSYNAVIDRFLSVHGGPYLVPMRAMLFDRPVEGVPRRRVGQHYAVYPEEDLVSGLESVVARCSHLLEHLPAAPASPPRPRDRFAELRDSGLIDKGQIDGYISRMDRRRTKAEIQGAIGAAKELMEALYRVIAPMVGATIELNNYPHTAKNVRAAVVERALPPRTTLKARKAISETLNACGQLDYRLAELRNELGTGHGRAKAPPGLRAYHAELAIDLAELQSRLLLSMLVDSRIYEVRDRSPQTQAG